MHFMFPGFWVSSTSRKTWEMAEREGSEVRGIYFLAQSYRIILSHIPWPKEGPVVNFNQFSLSTGSSNCLPLSNSMPQG